MVRAGGGPVPLAASDTSPPPRRARWPLMSDPKEQLRLERSLDLEGPYPRDLSFVRALASFIFSP